MNILYTRQALLNIEPYTRVKPTVSKETRTCRGRGNVITETVAMTVGHIDRSAMNISYLTEPAESFVRMALLIQLMLVSKHSRVDSIRKRVTQRRALGRERL